MRFQAIIFDFDGVIADSEVILNQALADGLTTIGLPTSLSDSLRDYSGKRWADILMMVEGQLDHELPSSFIGQQIASLGQKVMRDIKPVAGVDIFLRMSRLIPRAIASSGDQLWIRPLLSGFGLFDHFGEHIYSTTNLKNGKPHPEVYLLAAAKLEIAPEHIVAIEDSVAGVEAAIAAGMTVVGLTAASHIGPNDANHLRSAGAHYVAEDYECVAEWIELII
jgi:beta-phosphoglucomutase-like phosphatase (HAD superfamily)